MLRINQRSEAGSSAADVSNSVDALPVQATQIQSKRNFQKLAIFQSTVLALIIGLSCLLLFGIVQRFLHGGFALPQQAVPAVEAGKAMPAGKAIPVGKGVQPGKGVHMQMGTSGDEIRWRFHLEGAHDRIVATYTGKDGAAYILSESEQLEAGKLRLDVVSASGKIIGSSTEQESSPLLAVGADGALYRQEDLPNQQVPCTSFSAFDIQNHRLWQAQMPHTFTGALAVGTGGTVYAVGVTPQTVDDAAGRAHSCLCALKPTGESLWTYEHEGSLYWPQPLDDGEVLVWSCPRYDASFIEPRPISYVRTNSLKLAFQLLLIGNDGQLRWSRAVGFVTKPNASAAGDKVCAQLAETEVADNQQLVLLDRRSGRELARYYSGPLTAQPLLLPDGALVFQNTAKVLTKLSPKMKAVLWTKAYINSLRHAPLADSDGALYFTINQGLTCLEANGSERFRIPTGKSDFNHYPMWGPDGMIYIPTVRQLLAFKPE